MAIIKDVVSYGGGPKPGQMVVGNGADGSKTTLFDAAVATNGTNAFLSLSKLTSWDVELPNLTNGTSMFQGSGITSWAVDLPNLENGQNMFRGCNALTSWAADLPNLESGQGMFFGCNYITSWAGSLPKLSNGQTMFYNCIRLTSWAGDLPNLKNGDDMFAGGAPLTSLAVDLPNLESGKNMFGSCRLDAGSVLRILNSIPSYTSGSHILHLGSRTNFLNSTEIATLLGTTTPISAATSYSYKGWTITAGN